MKAVGYARCEDEVSADAACKEVAEWCKQNGHYVTKFYFDLQSGQRGLQRSLRGADEMLAVLHLHDLGRGLQELIKNGNRLLARGVTISVAKQGMTLQADAGAPDSRVLVGLEEAHKSYVRANIRIGVRAAKEAGATVGRPNLSFRVVANTINEMRNEDAKNGNLGMLPSVRRLAKRLNCGVTTAHRHLRRYKRR